MGGVNEWKDGRVGCVERVDRCVGDQETRSVMNTSQPHSKVGSSSTGCLCMGGWGGE